MAPQRLADLASGDPLLLGDRLVQLALEEDEGVVGVQASYLDPLDELDLAGGFARQDERGPREGIGDLLELVLREGDVVEDDQGFDPLQLSLNGLGTGFHRFFGREERPVQRLK